MTALSKITAEQVMSSQLLTVCESWSIQKLIHFFNENKVSGAPVTSREGQIVGVVSRGDIIQFDENPHHALAENPMAHYYLNACEGTQVVDMALPEGNQHVNHLVSEIMTPNVIAVESQTPIIEIASLMAAQGVHRVFIQKNGEICGAVSTLDILGKLEAAA